MSRPLRRVRSYQTRSTEAAGATGASHFRRAAVEALESRTLLTAGGLDLSFGSGSKVLGDYENTTDDAAQQAALDSNGRVVAITHSRLVRYAAEGWIDSTFGTDLPYGIRSGSILLPFTPSALAVRADNKIVVAGVDPADADNVLIARYTADGKLDASFGGGDGLVGQPFFGGDQTGPKVIAKLLIRPDNNRIYLAGTVDPYDSGLYDWALSAYTDTGVPYDQFSALTTTHWGYTAGINDAVLTPDNKILAVGYYDVADAHHPDVQGDFAIARYDEHGVLDPSFSGDGKQLVNFGIGRELNPVPVSDPSFDVAQSVAVDANNNLVVAGFSFNPINDAAPYYTSVARLKADGSLDPSFGPGGFDGDGRVSLDLATRATTAPTPTPTQVALLPQGQLLIGTAAAQWTTRDFVLARLNADGAFDNTFGRAGQVHTDFGFWSEANADNAPASLLVQPGKAVLVGGWFDSVQSMLALARYSLDTPSPYGGTPLRDCFTARRPCNAQAA